VKPLILLPLLAGAVAVIFVVRRSRKHASDEALLQQAVDGGVIDRMPADHSKTLKDVERILEEAKEWAKAAEKDPKSILADGRPNYERLYPTAIEKHVRNFLDRSLSDAERELVDEAADHFAAYWRSREKNPTFDTDDGKPDWVMLNLQMQDHFRQYTPTPLRR
jgi:hypothetical protein